MYNNSYITGKVWHKRFSPKIHEFTYNLNSWLIDLQKVEELSTSSLLINSTKRALYRFKAENYLRDSNSQPLIAKIKHKLLELNATLSGNEQFYLIGQLNNIGAYFSPLNLYLCYENTECSYILAEVSNTPWNERHYYLLNPRETKIINRKSFHVSPFFGLEQEYHWEFNLNAESIKFKINTYENSKLIFSAAYSGELTPLKSAQTRILRSPLNVYKILMGIYFEAFRIWSKKIPFIHHPRSN
jgi:DUF1365 family protein